MSDFNYRDLPDDLEPGSSALYQAQKAERNRQVASSGETWNAETGEWAAATQCDSYLDRRAAQLNAATSDGERQDLAYRLATAADLFPFGEIAPDRLTPEQQAITEAWSREYYGL